MIFSTQQIEGFLGHIKPKKSLSGRAAQVKAFREKRIEALIKRFGPGVDMRCDDMALAWGIDYRAASSMANRLADEGVMTHCAVICPNTKRPRSVYRLTALAMEGRSTGGSRCLN